MMLDDTLEIDMASKMRIMSNGLWVRKSYCLLLLSSTVIFVGCLRELLRFHILTFHLGGLAHAFE